MSILSDLLANETVVPAHVPWPRAVVGVPVWEEAGRRLAAGDLTLLGLWAVRQQPSDYARLAHLDPSMLLATFGLALLGSLLAGALPAWRACLIPPALQLKAQ